MDKKSAAEQVLAAYEKLTRQNSRIKALEKKLADGTITMKEGAELNDLRARAFGRAFSGKVLDIAQGEREGTCTVLLREGCNDVDELAQAAQRAVLARQGLNLTPPTAPFEEERARKIGHSLEDQTVPDETIERRAKSATETMLRSQYDRNMERGAKTCASAGLKTSIIRDAAPGCCKWCSDVAGRYTYGEEPKDVYRRHDNCSCTVVYESGRGRQNVWSKQYWSAEQEREYLRLRDEMKAKKMTETPDVKKPVRLSEKEVQAIIAKVGGLTFSGNGDIIEHENIRHSADYNVPTGLFESESFRNKFKQMSDDPIVQEQYYKAAKEILTHRSGTNGEDLYYYNPRLGKWYKSKEGTQACEPEYNAEIYLGLSESKKNEIVAFHNHAGSNPPSIADLNTALQNNYNRGYIFCHNGRIFEYSSPKTKVSQDDFDDYSILHYTEGNMSEIDARIEALKILSVFNGFDFREVT